jgi:hypothetical protein
MIEGNDAENRAFGNSQLFGYERLHFSREKAKKTLRFMQNLYQGSGPVTILLNERVQLLIEGLMPGAYRTLL